MAKFWNKGLFLVFGLVSGVAWADATPEPQTCAPMEVLHSSSNGLVYALNCQVGAWKLNYSGAVPAVSGTVTAAYRLKATSPSGEVTQYSRSMTLPDIGKLGQYLVREAVSISGDLALRDCQAPGCSKYKLMGGATAQAVTTQNPELVRARAEISRLQAALDTALSQLSEVQATGAALEAQSAAEREKLADQVRALSGVKTQTVHVKTLLAQAKEDMAKLRAQAVQSPEGSIASSAAASLQQTRIAALEKQLAAAQTKGGAVSSAAASAALEATKRAAEAEREASAAKQAELAKQKAGLEEEVARLIAQQRAQAERMQGLEQQLVTRTTEISALEARVSGLTGERDAMAAKAAELEKALALSRAETAILERAINQLTGEEPAPTPDPVPAADGESSEVTVTLPGSFEPVKVKKGRKKSSFNLW